MVLDSVANAMMGDLEIYTDHTHGMSPGKRFI